MLEWLGNAATSILGGGVTGILGVAVQSVFAYKNKQLDLELNKQKLDHDLAMKNADLQIMSQEWAQRTKVAEIEAAGKESVADAQAFAASYNEPQRYSADVHPNTAQGWLLVTLDFIRGIVRPGLTIYLCILTTMVYLQVKPLVGTGLSPVEALGLLKIIIDTILYLTTACVLYWFGTRVKAQPPKI
jgi:hypothetical protein